MGNVWKNMYKYMELPFNLCQKKKDFGYRACHIARNWINFHKLSDKITVWKYTTNITVSTITSNKRVRLTNFNF